MESGLSGDALPQQDGAPVWGADGWNGADNQTPADEEDGGEYDPESVVLTSMPAPVVERPVSESPRPSKKPKAGGFIIENSSDEEDDTPTPAPAYPSNTLKPTPSEIQTRPFSHSPLQQITTPQDITNHSPAQAHNTPILGETTSTATTANAARSRLPTDIVGILEDRIKEDPRGDIEAWLALIEEQKRRNNVEDARAVYERFLKVFPHAAEIWVAYLEMELSLDNTVEAESIFTRTLRAIPDVQLWTCYLNYIRRRNDLNDPTGRARQTVSQSYEFVLNNIGQDRDAGSIWQDYIQFIKTGPGNIGGPGWQDQQKMDVLRKAYQRAISIPMANVNYLWKEYDQFEMGLNKMTGRKFLQERSPSYMTARSANTHLENITRGLKRTTLPRLPPAPGFEGDQEYLEQVRLWKSWISWEKNDPLVLQPDDQSTYRQRVLQVYKQALMALRFWPEMWVEAAEWCFENNITSEDGQDTGLQFLSDGLEANPESLLIALKHADRIESTQPPREDDVNKAALVQAIREPCDRVLETLYGMIKKLKDQETATIAKIEEEASLSNAVAGNVDADDEDEGEIKEKTSAESIKNNRIKAIQDGFGIQIQILSQHITYVWIALARIYRRLQGQGHGRSTPSVGLRGIFIEARQRGRLTSDIYVEVANMEWDIYQDAVGTKIYERGAKLFPEQEDYFVEYLKHLHAKRDFTNARVVFSQTVKRFKEKPELIPKLKPIYAYFHGYEARYGELAQVKELEKQMTELFPEEPGLTHFAARFSTRRFNPITARVIISPARQMRPKTIMQSVEQPSISARSSPRPIPQLERSPQPPTINSPKRPFESIDQEDFPPRKLARGASPLKGAAGRRLDQQRRAQGQSNLSHVTAPAPLPSDVNFFISQLPPTDTFRGHVFNPESMVRLIQKTPVPSFSEYRAQKEGVTSTQTHTRQASSEYPAFSFSNRDSPGPSGRPASPYGVNRGIAQASSYRSSPLRPGSSGSYEPPPAVYSASNTSQFNPLAQNLAPGNTGFVGWQGAYVQPPQYNTAPPQQQQYGYYQ